MLGIHRLLSSVFVFINIIGNAVATVVVAARENAVDRATLLAELDLGYIPREIDTPAGDDGVRHAPSAGVTEAHLS